MQGKGLSAGVQAVQNAGAYAQFEVCIKAASGKCATGNPASNDDPDCQQYCMIAGHQSTPQCSSTVASCANPTYASQNASMCVCVNNPTSAGCPGVTALASATPSLNGLDGNAPYANDPKAYAATPANNGSSGGSTGFNGGNGSTSPIGGPSAGGGKGNTNDAGKDILLGTGGAAGGGYGGGSGGGYADGGGSGKCGAGGGIGGLDLRAFLPSGKNDWMHSGFSRRSIPRPTRLAVWRCPNDSDPGINPQPH